VAAQADRRLRLRPRKFYAGLIADVEAHASALFDQSFRRTADGTPWVEHVAAARAAGVQVDVEEPPACPGEAAYLLHWFGDLSAQRSAGMSGPNALAWADIAAWAALHGRRLSRFEIRVLTMLDRLYRSAAAKAAERERTRK
jgi:hypothetical protein